VCEETPYYYYLEKQSPPDIYIGVLEQYKKPYSDFHICIGMLEHYKKPYSDFHNSLARLPLNNKCIRCSTILFSLTDLTPHYIFSPSNLTTSQLLMEGLDT
jgi:hypothetical protein